MSIDNAHRPTADFREHLEWEVVSAFRRQQRINASRHARSSGISAGILMAAFAWTTVCVENVPQRST